MFRLLYWRQRQQRWRWYRPTILPLCSNWISILLYSWRTLFAFTNEDIYTFSLHFIFIYIGINNFTVWHTQKLYSKALNIQRKRPSDLDFIQRLVIKCNSIWLFYDFTWKTIEGNCITWFRDICGSINFTHGIHYTDKIVNFT